MRTISWQKKGSRKQHFDKYILVDGFEEIEKVFDFPIYDCVVKVVDDKKLIYFIDCTCWNFVNRRIKNHGVFADKQFYSEPCKHLKVVVDALISQGYTLKQPRKMEGTDRCTAALRRLIMERSGGLCEFPGSKPCQNKIAEIHRKVPGVNGGKYIDWNCVGLCLEHHQLETYQKWHGTPGTKK